MNSPTSSPGVPLSSYPAASARDTARAYAIRPRDVLLLVPAIALGLLLLAVHQADRTSSPLSSMLNSNALASLVPNALGAGGHAAP